MNTNKAKKVELLDLLERAWGIIANVSGGDWTKQDNFNKKWRPTAIKWRDSYHKILDDVCPEKAKGGT